MAKSSPRCVITSRDLEVLAALDRCPLTAQQLLKLSRSFCLPFTTERRVRERLQQLERQHWLTSWLYATASRGGSPSYWKLTRDGYRVLHGTDAVLPQRRFFEEIALGHHHTMSLSDFIVQTFVAAHRLGIEVRYFARENSVRMEAAGSVLYPDCAFQLFTPGGSTVARPPFNFVVELDNGTERIRSPQDVESIERKVRGYELHQSATPSFDHGRFVVLFVTTRSSDRLTHILQAAARIMRNPKRTLFLGVTLSAFLTHDAPLTAPLFLSPTGRQQSLISDDSASRQAFAPGQLATAPLRPEPHSKRPTKTRGTPTQLPVAA